MGLITVLERLIGRYYKVVESKNEIKSGLADLWKYIRFSANRLAYQSNGAFGLYDDLNTDRRIVDDKLRNIDRGINSLEAAIFGGETSQKVSGTAESPIYGKQSKVKSAALSMIVGLGAAISTYSILKKRCERARSIPQGMLEKIIDKKNKSYGMSLDKFAEQVNQEYAIRIGDTNKFFSDVMFMKSNYLQYDNLPSINYDERIAPDGMVREMIKIYHSSEMSLLEASKYLEKKYGMHISPGTLSKHARRHLSEKGINFRNRKDARLYFQSNPNR